ncbi:MAG: 1,5-anhydro-D-fructose reductase [Lentisphaerae bacterium ADurb.Bin082]|nr:MAG: 1,5-anhydro-D-fructose reductase [Lentisphaerae bacterium ADurb.Bin082]
MAASSSAAPVSIVLVGIGGYGNTAVDALLKNPLRQDWQLVGVVDPVAEKAAAYAELKSLGLPFYNTLDEFYQVGKADLAFISSPIQFHAPQTCTALAHGTNVLCEKPACATIQEARQMAAARDAAGRFAAIGYQWSYAQAVLDLKADIQAGRLGQPRRLKTMWLWPRNDAYYARNNWAGARQSPQGDWILDSPASNACAHYLHNMLFVLGRAGQAAAAQPRSVQAELYRANPITSYDTAAMRIMTDDDVEILFYTTHAVSRNSGLELIYEFDEATATYNTSKHLVVHFNNGTVKDYGTPAGQTYLKYRDAIATVQGEKTMACTIDSATPHIICINAAENSVNNEIAEFPAGLVYKMGVPGSQVRVMTGLTERFTKAYQSNILPAELGACSWARLGKIVDTTSYDVFCG